MYRYRKHEYMRKGGFTSKLQVLHSTKPIDSAPRHDEDHNYTL